MDSLAVSQIESDLWPPHSWPLRWPTAIVCFWPSAAQLSRHRRCASQPCFHRVKWKVHNPLLIAVPWAVEQPQLNTGQSWLPANLSNKPTSSLFPPKNVIRFFSPPSVPFTLTPAAGHPDLFYLHWLSSKWLTLTTRVYLSFVSSCGNREGLAFCFPSILSDKLVYLYTFSCWSARIQKACVLWV